MFVAADAMSAPGGGYGPLPNEGSLGTIPGEQLLQRLHHEQRSGVLTIFAR